MNPSLTRFTQTLRPYQADCVKHVQEFVAKCYDEDLVGRSARRLYSAPTGSGKGTLQLALLDKFANAWIVTPSLEVIRGFLERCGVTPEELCAASADDLVEAAARIRVTTPLRLRNSIDRGLAFVPPMLIVDEAHHAVEDAEVAGTLFAYGPESVWVGFTATGFRGTPQGTKDLRDAWGEPWEVISVHEALAEGYWNLPTFEVRGLVDDDKVRVQGGKFVVSAAGRAVQMRSYAIAQLVADECCAADKTLLHPTTVVAPSGAAAGAIVEALDSLGIDSYWVSAKTKAKDRARAYRDMEDCRAVLVSIAILGEGVDFPWLGCMIDARPTMSPVAWMQLVGRLTRPKDYRPRYICVCRNLERHAYLLEGLVPRKAIAASQKDFGEPSKRLAARSIGLEALAKFKAITLPLAGGVKGHMYALTTTTQDGKIRNFVSVVLPEHPTPIHAERTNTHNGVEYTSWGKWSRCELPDGLTGFASSNWRGPASPKQQAWWERAAGTRWLDADEKKLTMRQFNVLPVLIDLGIRL